MLMLTSEQWLEHIRNRNSLIRSAQSRKVNPGWGIVPREAEGLQYVWDDEGQLQAIRVPIMTAHPYEPLSLEGLNAGEAVEVRRPNPKTAPEWYASWGRVFDPSRRAELEESPYLPAELMGSPKPATYWWAEPWRGMGRPEEGEPRRMIHPSVIDPSRLPSMETHGDVGWKHQQLADANIALIEMMELMREIATKASRAKTDPESAVELENMVGAYEELRQSLFMPLRQLAHGVLQMQSKVTGRPMEELESLIDTQSVTEDAVLDLFGTYYDPERKIKLKSGGHRPADPLTYVKGVIYNEINHLVQEHLREVGQTESYEGLTEGRGDAAEALVQDQRAMVEAFRNAPTEEDALSETAIVREQLVRDVDRLAPGLSQKLNAGFAAFLASGAVQLVSPMMTEGMMRKLFTPDGKPIFDIGAVKPVPESWCPNCGSVTVEGPNGEIQPAMYNDNETYRCQSCTAPIAMSSGKPKEVYPGADGGEEGAYFGTEPFSMSEPSRRKAETSVILPMLAYLEMERQNSAKWSDAERRGIYHLMLGLPIVRVHQGQPTAPSKGHERRFSALTVPQAGRVVAMPTSFRRAASEQMLQSMQEQQMFLGGLGLGELVRGPGWDVSPVGYSYEQGRFPPPEEAEWSPLGYVTDPGSRAGLLAGEMAGRVTPTDPGQIVPGEELEPSDLAMLAGEPKQRSVKYNREMTSMLQQYTSSLVSHAMFYLGPTIPLSAGYVDPQTGQPRLLDAEQVISGLERTLRNGAYQIARAYQLDPDDVYEDMIEMVSYIDRISKTPGSSIKPEWIGDPMVSYVFSTLGGPSAGTPEDLSAAVAGAFTPKKANPKQAAAIAQDAAAAVEKAAVISQQGQAIEETATKIRERQFDLGWQILEAAEGPAATRLQHNLSGRMTEFVRGVGRPFINVEETVQPTVERQFGTMTEGGEVQKSAEAEKLRQELALSIVGMFGFGNRYDGHPGVVHGTSGTIDARHPNFTLDMELDLPDGAYQMFSEGRSIPVAKHGNSWRIWDVSKLPKGFKLDSGSDVSIDESVAERSGKPGGGSEIAYRTSGYYSPDAIAERWGVAPDQVKSLQASVLLQGVDSIFSQRAYDPMFVTKYVFTGLLPPVLTRLFSQARLNRFLQTKEKENWKISPEELIYQDDVGRAASFVLDVGKAIESGTQSGGVDQSALQDVMTMYPEVPPQYLYMVAREILERSGPSYRTYLVASNYADRLRVLSEPFELSASEMSSMMVRNAAPGGFQRG